MSKSLTQEALIKEIAQEANLSQDKTKSVLRLISKMITSYTNQGKTVTLPDLGRFEKKTRAAKTGINPKTKEKIQIPAKHYLSFRAGKLTQETINSRSNDANENS